MRAIILSDAGEISRRASRPLLTEDTRLWPWALAVLALAALLIFPRLGERTLWGPEGRWAEITREMQLSGNYFWPTINGKVYYDKPLLSYWLVAGAARLTGGINEAAVRLPSAVAGLLGVVLVILLARRLYGSCTAILASFILATSYSYVFFSRTASADMETVAGVLAALALFVCNEQQQKGWWVVWFWLIMVITSLTKGLQGFALPLLVIGGYSLVAEGWRSLLERVLHDPLGKKIDWVTTQGRWLLNGKAVSAMVAAVLVYSLPFVISYFLMHSNIGIYKVLRENVIRFVDPFDHQEPIYFYLYRIFGLMAPWSFFLPAALVQMHSNSQGKSDRFILVYFWAIFLFFTFSGSRRDYYLLPLLPAAAILVARLFVEQGEKLRSLTRKLMDLGYLLMALLVVTAGALALLPPALRPGMLREFPTLPGRMVFAAFWLLQLATLGYALLDLRPKRIFFSSSTLAFLGLLFLFVFAFPGAERYRGEKAFAYAVRSELKGDLSQLVLYRVWGPGLLFYLSAANPISVYGDGTGLAQVIENNPDRWIISHERDLKSLPIGGSVANVSQAFLWQKSPHLRVEYVLIWPKAVAKKEDG